MPSGRGSEACILPKENVFCLDAACGFDRNACTSCRGLRGICCYDPPGGLVYIMMHRSGSRFETYCVSLLFCFAPPIGCGGDGAGSSAQVGGTSSSGGTGTGGTSAASGEGGSSAGTSALGSAGAGSATVVTTPICVEAQNFSAAKANDMACEAVGDADVQCERLVAKGCEALFRDLFSCVKAQPASNWQCMMDLGPVVVDMTPCQKESDAANVCVPPT